MATLLIVGDNERLCMSIKEEFSGASGYEVVGLLSGGCEAIEFFETGPEPEVAIIDMMMPVIDGVELLYQLKRRGLGANTTFIGMSAFHTDESLRLAQTLGMAYFISLPVGKDVIRRRVTAMLEPGTEQSSSALEEVEKRRYRFSDREEVVTKYMMALGISAHHTGFRYIRDAVVMCLDNSSANLGMTTDIYPGIAEKYGTSAKTVERSIRYAIEVAWLRGDVDAQHTLFGYTVNEDKGKPTNMECITILVERSRIRMS